MLSSAALASVAQAPAGNAPAQPAAAAQAPAPVAPPAPSTFLQPALDGVKKTISNLDLDRWKKGGIRDEAERDIGAILQDMQENVPPLMKDADADPGALSKTLPLSRHIDALYDVVLRVEEAGRVVAPVEQVDQLQSALKNLGEARLALDKQMLESAVTQEKQLTDLHTKLQAAAAVKCPAPPPPPVCPAPKPHKAVRKRKPSAKTPPKSPAKTTTPPATQKTGP